VENVEDNGHARVPASYTVDGHRLGAWVGFAAEAKERQREGGRNKLVPDLEQATSANDRKSTAKAQKAVETARAIRVRTDDRELRVDE